MASTWEYCWRNGVPFLHEHGARAVCSRNQVIEDGVVGCNGTNRTALVVQYLVCAFFV